jgi:hypothetical protein
MRSPRSPCSEPGSLDDDPGVVRHRAALKAVLARGGTTLEDLWLVYFGLGGAADVVDVEGYLQGLLPLPAAERDVLAQAANERLDDLAGRLRVPYSRQLRAPMPDEGPLTALVRLLEHAPQALSGRLAQTASDAGRALGATEAVLYLADYEQRRLLPVPGLDVAREPLSIEGTLPGRAFQTATTQVTRQPVARLWVPVVDGAERLGVLDVMLTSPAEADDPHLRSQAGWLASLLAHLVVATAAHGDVVDAVRRSRPRSAGAELVWALLPPLAAGSEQFSIAGLLEPVYDVGGDAFDYALGDDRVRLAVFDAMGHSLGSGLVVATALSAYRAARRAGSALYAQAAAIDGAIDSQFPDAFATGVLADLQLGTGRLRYVAAGHPPPLLLREGRVVATLDGGRRTPFGIGGGELTVGEASLQPGDWLVLYTDGITEARDADGTFFGQHRLVDFLEREALADLPPAETARRLIHAVLRHQGGSLQDDATILFARWAPPPQTPPPPDPR